MDDHVTLARRAPRRDLSVHGPLLAALLERASWRRDQLLAKLALTQAQIDQARMQQLAQKAGLDEERVRVPTGRASTSIEPALARLRLAWFCAGQQRAQTMADRLAHLLDQHRRLQQRCVRQQQQCELLAGQIKRAVSEQARQAGRRQAREADEGWLAHRDRLVRDGQEENTHGAPMAASPRQAIP